MTFSNGIDTTTETAGLVREWTDSRHVCALADQDRHWGHVVLTDCWHAYDAVHPNELGTGFTYLGAFVHRNEARNAVEESVARVSLPKVKGAGAGSSNWNAKSTKGMPFRSGAR